MLPYGISVQKDHLEYVRQPPTQFCPHWESQQRGPRQNSWFAGNQGSSQLSLADIIMVSVLWVTSMVVGVRGGTHCILCSRTDFSELRWHRCSQSRAQLTKPCPGTAAQHHVAIPPKAVQCSTHQTHGALSYSPSSQTGSACTHRVAHRA